MPVGHLSPKNSTEDDGTAVVTTSVREFLPDRISTDRQPAPRRTQSVAAARSAGEPVSSSQFRLPERMHQGSQSASPAREMRSRACAISKCATVATSARLGRVAWHVDGRKAGSMCRVAPIICAADPHFFSASNFH